MNKRNVLIAVTTAAVIGSGVAYAGSKRCGGKHDVSPGHRVDHMVMKMDKRLDLTDAQETEIRTILLSGAEQFASVKDTRRKLRQAVLTLDPAAADFDSQVDSLANEIAETFRQKTVETAEIMKQVSGVLTEEQADKAKKIIARMMEHRNNRRDHESEWHDHG